MIAASLQITDKGIPVVYYGEELGMTGKNGMENGDANRYDMEWSRLKMKLTIKFMSIIRSF